MDLEAVTQEGPRPIEPWLNQPIDTQNDNNLKGDSFYTPLFERR